MQLGYYLLRPRVTVCCMGRGTPKGIKARQPGTLMGTSEVCEDIDIARSTLMRWMRAGTFVQPVDILRSTPVWRRSDIDKWKAQA